MKDRKLGAGGLVSIVLAVLNGIGLMVSVGCSLHIRRQFIQIFQELEVELPAMTQMILNVHWAIWILLSIILLAILAAKELIPKKWIPLLINGLYVLLGIIYWAVFSTAMMIPLMSLVQEMS